MLSDRFSQLLTAYVDGELSPKRRKAVERLLSKSRQARALFRKLEKDSQRLRALPAATAPDLAGPVLGAIHRQGLHPAPESVPAAAAAATPPAFPTWAGLAIAASVLLAVATASYLYFSQGRPGTQPESEIAQPKDPAGPATPKKVPIPPDDPGARFTLAELSSQGERTRLVRELHKDTSFRLNLSCKDSSKGVARLGQAMNALGIGLVVEKRAQKQLENKEAGASYLVYAENLQPGEVLAVLRYLGNAGKEPGRAALCQSVIVSGLTSEHRHDLARLLGTSIDRLAGPPVAPTPKKVPLAPLGDTIIEVPAGADAQPGNPPRKGRASHDRMALVLAYDAGTTATPGPEVHDFLRHRQQQRPGTLQVVLVLREVSA
jgi:hypothetical protein